MLKSEDPSTSIGGFDLSAILGVQLIKIIEPQK
jgi:hypothetical protein